MKPVVYIDMLFLLNFLMNSATLYATSVFLRKPLGIFRLALTSTLGAIYSSVMFFPQVSVLYSVFSKAVFWFLTVILAFPTRLPKEILKSSLTFFAVNLIFGGFVFALIFATNFGTVSGSVVSNGEIYLDIGLGTLVFSAIGAYAVVFVISHIKKQNILRKRITSDILIFFNEKSTKLTALHDTGCTLTDPFSGYPAVIISPSIAKALIPPDFPQMADPSKYRILPFCTIDNPCGFLHGFIPDKLFIDGKEIHHSVVAVSKTDIHEFSAILNPKLIEENIPRKAVNIHHETEIPA